MNIFDISFFFFDKSHKVAWKCKPLAYTVISQTRHFEMQKIQNFMFGSLHENTWCKHVKWALIEVRFVSFVSALLKVKLPSISTF